MYNTEENKMAENKKFKRKIIIAGNWKMNKIPAESEVFLKEFMENIQNTKCKIILFVPFVDMETCIKSTEKSQINIGAQNFYWRESGAYTGEISIPMLDSIGVKFLLVGHSERRMLFHETDKEVNEKTKKAVESNMNVILCVGETTEQRDDGTEKEAVMIQLEKGLKNVPKSLIHKICIAYEPVWAIGTGQTASPEESNKMCRFIRMCIEKMYGSEVGLNLDILYGGSVDKENCNEFLKMSDINGVLVGGASLSADKFCAIVKNSENLIREGE